MIRPVPMLLLLALSGPASCAGDPAGAPVDGGDPDAGGDADSDTDADSDSDADGDGDPSCPEGYPAGPYDWALERVVSPVAFRGIHGSGGEVSQLDMCDVWQSREQLRSLVFALGAQG